MVLPVELATRDDYGVPVMPRIAPLPFQAVVAG